MSKRITIYTPQILKQDGSAPIIGGAERYIRDLAHLMKRLGYDPEFYQYGTHDWESSYEGFSVRGFKKRPNEKDTSDDMDLVSSDRVLYAWYGMPKRIKPGSITISHGIWFDHPNYTHPDIVWQIHPIIYQALVNSACMVSVDSAFLNYCRGTFPDAMPAAKIQYIPNYVDLDAFVPQPKEQNDGMLTILYPRRLDKARGIDETKVLAEWIMHKYPDVKFHFAIDRNAEDTWNDFITWQQNSPHKNRIEYGTYHFDQIKEAYRKSDIVLIPTQWAEGTSLSCIEAMAMGKPIVATQVGGLTDLIINGHNGILTGTAPLDMFNGLTQLIDNPTLRQSLSRNALIVAESFSKTRWEAQWSDLIKRFY